MTTDSPILPIRSAFSNVVALEPTQQCDAAISFSACRDLQAYWEALRGTRQMPARAEFDPRGIEQTLACTFVAEKVAPSVARIRVAGSVLNDALGMDVRGMPITAFFDPDSRDALSEATRDLFSSPAMVVIELEARRSFGRKPIRARMLLLPMSDAEGQITRLVGCLDIAGGLGKAPRRFEVTSLRRADLSGTAPNAVPARVPFQPMREERSSEPEITPIPSYAFAEAAIEFQSSRRSSKEIPSKKHSLRLVVCND